MVFTRLIKRSQLAALSGEPSIITDKKFSPAVWIEGFLFGLSWVLIEACPSPPFAQPGSSLGSVAELLMATLASAWIYSPLREKLPL